MLRTLQRASISSPAVGPWSSAMGLAIALPIGAAGADRCFWRALSIPRQVVENRASRPPILKVYIYGGGGCAAIHPFVTKLVCPDFAAEELRVEYSQCAFAVGVGQQS